MVRQAGCTGYGAARRFPTRIAMIVREVIARLAGRAHLVKVPGPAARVVGVAVGHVLAWNASKNVVQKQKGAVLARRARWVTNTLASIRFGKNVVGILTLFAHLDVGILKACRSKGGAVGH